MERCGQINSSVPGEDQREKLAFEEGLAEPFLKGSSDTSHSHHGEDATKERYWALQLILNMAVMTFLSSFSSNKHYLHLLI